MNAAGPPSVVQMANGERVLNQAPSRRLSAVVDAANGAGHGSHTKNLSNASGVHDRALQEIQPPQAREWKELLDAQQESFRPRFSICC
jgi:hypothetical protein